VQHFARPHEHVVDALHDDAHLGAADGVARLRRLRDDGRLLGDLLRLQRWMTLFTIEPGESFPEPSAR
jgi:hypothetical protein